MDDASAEDGRIGVVASASPAASASRTKASTGIFASEVQLMMHGFGDVSKPLLESALLIEKIVRREVVVLIDAAVDVALERSARGVGIEDFLFLFRRDKDKLHRLVQYLRSKDIKTAATKDMDDSLPDSLEEVKESRWKGGKKTKLSRQFLATIDSADELIATVDQPGIDAIRLERLQRAEVMSKKMDMVQFVHFNQAKGANFGRDVTKMREWLAASCPSVVQGAALDDSAASSIGSEALRLTPGAFELLAYVVYETVAQIVDLALLVKQDRGLDVDPLGRLMPLHFRGTPEATAALLSRPLHSSHASVAGATGQPTAASTGQLDAGAAVQQQQMLSPAAGTLLPAAHASTSGHGAAASAAGRKQRLNETDRAIQPHEIREAMRRYSQGSLLLASAALGVGGSAQQAATSTQPFCQQRQQRRQCHCAMLAALHPMPLASTTLPWRSLSSCPFHTLSLPSCLQRQQRLQWPTVQSPVLTAAWRRGCSRAAARGAVVRSVFFYLAAAGKSNAVSCQWQPLHLTSRWILVRCASRDQDSLRRLMLR